MKRISHAWSIVALLLALIFSMTVHASSLSHLTVKEWLKGSVEINQAQVKLGFSILIDIADLDQYLKESLHQAPVTGTVDMGDALKSMPIIEGWCRFFIDSDQAGLKYMTYRIVFDHPVYGRTTLFGKKVIHADHHGLDLWSDSTTVYVELFEGEVQAPSDSPLPADHGMGKLRIHPTDFVRSIESIRAPEMKGLASLRLKARFGEFFFGEFWQVYGPKLPKL